MNDFKPGPEAEDLDIGGRLLEDGRTRRWTFDEVDEGWWKFRAIELTKMRKKQAEMRDPAKDWDRALKKAMSQKEYLGRLRPASSHIGAFDTPRSATSTSTITGAHTTENHPDMDEERTSKATPQTLPASDVYR